jgi:hypothetical protein
VQAPFTTSITSSTTSVTTVHDDNRQSSTIWLPRKKGTTIISSNAGDVIAPVVAITEPTGSATVSGTVTLLALASDNIGISSVQFQVNGSDIGERVTSAPFTLDWDTSHSEDGAYILTAVARDAAGNQTISEAVTVEVDNLPTTYTLTTVRSGSGVGIITSSPAGINCGSSCSAVFNSGGHISLTPMAGAGSVFIGWSGGGCAGTGICTVTLDSDTTVTAQFALNDFALTVNSAGSGSGIVTSTPAGIACGATCVANFTYGSMVSLIASPGPGSNFAGWGGSCSGLGACVVTMTAANNVTALFSAVP